MLYPTFYVPVLKDLFWGFKQSKLTSRQNTIICMALLRNKSLSRKNNYLEYEKTILKGGGVWFTPARLAPFCSHDQKR